MARNNGARKPLFYPKNGKVPVNAQPLQDGACELIVSLNGRGCSNALTSLSYT